METNRTHTVCRTCSWVWVAFCLVMLGCGRDDREAGSGNSQGAAVSEQSSPSGDGSPGAKPRPPMDGGSAAPAWGANQEGSAWSRAVQLAAARHLGALERARDLEVFCPGYSRASRTQRLQCWVFLVAAVAKFESNFQPEESFREPDGRYSVGLLALSPGECPEALSFRELQQPIPNLNCGVRKMAALISTFGYIDGPAQHRGASRYWSTLRAPYKHWDPSRQQYLELGKRHLILPLVRDYKRGARRAG